LRRFDGVDSLPYVPPPPTLSALSRPELEALLVKQFEDISTLPEGPPEHQTERYGQGD
jgi:hypothetical protein